MVLDEHKESSERSLEEVKKDINQLKEEHRALKMWSEQSLEEVKINNERRGLSIGEIWENMGEFSKDLETLKVSSEQSLEAVKKDTTQLQGGLEEIANDQLQERPIFEDPDEHEMSSEQLQPDCEEERPKPSKWKKQDQDSDRLYTCLYPGCASAPTRHQPSLWRQEKLS